MQIEPPVHRTGARRGAASCRGRKGRPKGRQGRSSRGCPTSMRAASQNARPGASGLSRGRRLAAAAKRDQPGNDSEGGRDGAAQVSEQVVSSRQDRVGRVWKLIDLGLVHQQEEVVESAVDALIAAVELCAGVTLLMQRREPGISNLMQVVDISKLD